MKKTITNIIILYIIYWILIILFTEFKNEQITVKHLEMSITIILLPLYLTGITEILKKLNRYLKHLK